MVGLFDDREGFSVKPLDGVDEGAIVVVVGSADDTVGKLDPTIGGDDSVGRSLIDGGADGTALSLGPNDEVGNSVGVVGAALVVGSADTAGL